QIRPSISACEKHQIKLVAHGKTPVVDRQLVQTPKTGRGCIVVKHVNMAVPVARALDPFPGLLRIAQIHACGSLDRAALIPNKRNGFIASPRINVATDHECACPGKTQCSFPPHAAADPGNDNHLAAKIKRHVWSHLYATSVT